MAKKPGKDDVDYRSAKTGRYVTEQYAKTHKATTVKETGRTKPKGKGK